MGLPAIYLMDKKILIINVTRIGDTLLTTPAIRAIATAFPDHQIDFFGHPKRAEVVKFLPFVHQVRNITKKVAPFKGWISKKIYDIAFVYGNDEALITYALRVAEKVVAFRQKNQRLNKRLFLAVEPPVPRSEHMVRQLLWLPEAMKIEPAGMRLSYSVEETEKLEARQILAQEVPVNAYPLIGLQVASFPTKAYRDWPIDNFIELCKRIENKWEHAHFLIFGSDNEVRKTAYLQSVLGNQSTLFAGKTSLRQTAALMSCTNLYVGVDTGPTHLMSAFDIPMVSLYHSKFTSHEFGPLEHPCAYQIDHPNSGAEASETDSMVDISVDEVWKMAEHALLMTNPSVTSIR